MISDAELRSIVQASDAGQAAADALKVGDVFMSAGPAADAAGFVALFSRMAAVPSTRTSPACWPRVITDREGRITLDRSKRRSAWARRRARPACGRH